MKDTNALNMNTNFWKLDIKMSYSYGQKDSCLRFLSSPGAELKLTKIEPMQEVV